MSKPMNRRTFINSCLAAGTLCEVRYARVESAVAGSANTKRNVLLLIADDHGIDQLGCYGNRVVRTPNLDSLAAEGVRFTHAFAIAASCSASRGTILSGLYTHQNGQFGHQHNYNHFSFHDGVVTLPALLSANGYRTGVIGKLHVAPPAQLPFDLQVPDGELMGNRDVSTMAQRAGEFFDADPERPFFLLVGYSDPHRAAKGFANDADYPGIVKKRYDPSQVPVPGFLPDEPEVREELADQYTSIDRLDRGVGMVLERLRRSGRYDDTLIIYISDNGIPFPGAKTTVYDSGVRLPMIVSAPGVAEPGLVNRNMVSYVDLLPTILEWTGSAGPGYPLPGRSFLPVLNVERSGDWETVYHSHIFHEITMYYPMRSVRTRRYRYILNLFPELEYPFATDLFASKTWQVVVKKRLERMGQRSVHAYLHRPAEELYDLEHDPVESVNLAGSDENRSILVRMRSLCRQWREKTGDPWLILDNYIENKTL